MRHVPVYNDKQSWYQSYNSCGWLDFPWKDAPWWPCPLKTIPIGSVDLNTCICFLKSPDSRSGMKGITIRKRMGKL